MKFINFTQAINNGKLYIDSNNKKKIIIIYNNQEYIIKMSKFLIDHNTKKFKQTFNPVAEYMGCQIYNSIGIPTQKTLLGFYQLGKEEKRIVVACKKFNNDNDLIFKELKDIIPIEPLFFSDLFTINNLLHKYFTPINKNIIDYFWNIFIIDSFLNIEDRGISNWGFIYNKNKNKLYISPIFDCEANCFIFKEDQYIKEEILSSILEIDYYALQPFKKSFLTINNEQINYFNVIKLLNIKECNEALKRMLPLINLEKINNIINNTPMITNLQKKFFILILKRRKEILDFYLRQLLKESV